MRDAGRFGVLRNVVELQLAIRADGPLLIRGPDSFVPDAPDMAFIRTPWKGEAVPFLPGSSLKGVLRTGAEMLLQGAGVAVCSPTDHRTRGGCGECPACLAFGSAKRGASVILVGDGMPWPPEADDEERRQGVAAVERQRTVRTGVAIDRQRGSVAVGPFDMEVLAGAVFYPTLALRNPGQVDLAVLAAALELLDAGILRLGSGTTKGLGRVEVEPRRLRAAATDPKVLPWLFDQEGGPPRRRGPLWWCEARVAAELLERWAEGLGPLPQGRKEGS